MGRVGYEDIVVWRRGKKGRESRSVIFFVLCVRWVGRVCACVWLLLLGDLGVLVDGNTVTKLGLELSYLKVR